MFLFFVSIFNFSTLFNSFHKTKLLKNVQWKSNILLSILKSHLQPAAAEAGTEGGNVCHKKPAKKTSLVNYIFEILSKI
ncbi:hypothetical protein OA86_02065 [Kaistella jeonii]|uniref:Uncharacterized protein n=1 Tax=Kaistella jeonii TaxID=266749 RepID=A0A0C1FS04_9FLAO|nr:hypothetical protein OA86_02065 [Kaistella jeonii]